MVYFSSFKISGYEIKKLIEFGFYTNMLKAFLLIRFYSERARIEAL